MTERAEAPVNLPPGCGLWIGWILASTAGATIGWIIAWRLSFIVPQALSTAVLGAAVGAALGSVQWLVLRGQIRRAGWWVLASTMGWAGGFSLGVLIAQQLGLSEIEFGLVIGLTTGASLGILQWLILRSQVSRAGWWIPASIFAWTSGLIYYQPGISGVGMFFGALSGLVTGTVLLWLLYRPVAEGD